MNTYGDPGADPVEEWGVERMTDAITADEYRTAAKVARTHGDKMTAEGWEDQAARLEAESARDEYAEKIGELARDSFTSCPDSFEVANWIVGRILLDQLAADGRLLPEGGTVPDVKPIGWYRTMAGDFACEHFGFPLYGDRIHEAADGGKWAWDKRMQVWELREYPPAVPVPDGGPDGTPEKPWPTAADVPDGVWFRSAKNRHWPARWLRCGNSSTDYADMVNPKPSALGYQVWHESAVNDHAPFVRVDGDKA